MTTALDLDRKKLKARAFDRTEWAEGVLRCYHATNLKLGDAVAQPLRVLYYWMLVPPTLWPFNVQDVLEDCLATLEKGKRLNSRHRLVIELRSEPPDDAVCAAMVGGVRGRAFEQNLRPAHEVVGHKHLEVPNSGSSIFPTILAGTGDYYVKLAHHAGNPLKN